MTMNQLAKEITLKEGLKKSVTIAQVKEVLRIFAEMCAEEYMDNKIDSWGCFRRYALSYVKQNK